MGYALLWSLSIVFWNCINLEIISHKAQILGVLFHKPATFPIRIQSIRRKSHDNNWNKILWLWLSPLLQDFPPNSLVEEDLISESSVVDLSRFIPKMPASPSLSHVISIGQLLESVISLSLSLSYQKHAHLYMNLVNPPSHLFTFIWKLSLLWTWGDLEFKIISSDGWLDHKGFPKQRAQQKCVLVQWIFPDYLLTCKHPLIWGLENKNPHPKWHLRLSDANSS